MYYIGFGINANTYSYIERMDKTLNIVGFCDNFPEKWGYRPMGDGREVISPARLENTENCTAIILPDKDKSVEEIIKQCEAMGIPWVLKQDILNECEVLNAVRWPQEIQRNRIHKFIELLISGTNTCNLHCSYCYVWRNKEFGRTNEGLPIDVGEVRRALSQDKLGGVCHINMCAPGETLMNPDIVGVTKELLEEGHYVSIITNGILSSKIDEILALDESLLNRLFFKLSFHYLELIEKGLIDIFWSNKERIKRSPASYSIEITPSDDIVDKIEDIKSYFTEKKEALPHITFTRDSTKKGLDLYSKLTLDEYTKIWSQFDSALFDLKRRFYQKKINDICYAGCWSYRINAHTGMLQSCYKYPIIHNIYKEDFKTYPLLTVKEECKLDYCFNNHAFLAWGDVPNIKCDTYKDVRDRHNEYDGSYWIKPDFAYAMKQKLYENNFPYQDYWDDYEKLFNYNRQASVVLFNSPDYSNIGDHAIALSTRGFFKTIFPEKDFIEISCQQYIRENLLIKQAIRNDDIIVINGGGNIGTLYLWIEDLIRNIIQEYPDNPIIIFPQTIYFEDSPFGKAEYITTKNIMNGHKKLLLTTRESRSYDIAIDIVGNRDNCINVPDIVFSMDRIQHKKRNGCLCCMRSDKESIINNTEDIIENLKERFSSVEEISTNYSRDFGMNERKEIVDDFLNRISETEVVVTDRLHCMIFCTLTNTPCVAFDNLSHKIKNTMYWIEDLKSIKLCSTPNELMKDIDNVCNVQQDADFNNIIGMYEKLQRKIYEFIGE